ncbi:MAG: poly(R)-hydroxyalkanoic acid synthase subunit PhaE [Lysobacteraceae bacterium]
MTSSDPFKDPLAFGRQLWQQWNAATQAVQPAQMASMPMPDWNSALGQWAKLFDQEGGDARRAADKLAAHGQQFFSLMQALLPAAARHNGAPDLAALWRRGLGDGNPMLDALRQVGAEGARGWEQWFGLAQTAAAPLHNDWTAALNLPAFGMARERQQEFNAWLLAQSAYAEAVQAYQQLLAKANEQGMQRFESKLAERSEPGRQIDSMRALFDLWVDAAEEAYAQIAMSPEFRDAYGELVNCQMRVKQLQNKAIERLAAEAGMPTRSELDGVLQRLRALQREVRQLRERPTPADTAINDAPADASSDAPEAAPAARPVRKPARAAKSAVPAKPAAKASATKAKSKRPPARGDAPPAGKAKAAAPRRRA